MSDADGGGQRSDDVRFDWGRAGLDATAPGCATVVVVDVLRFTSAVSVATARGATVLPYGWERDDAASYAASHQAELAGRTRDGWSLSPADLQRAPASLRLVLPSPNGSALAFAAQTVAPSAVVVAGALRNASVVGGFVASRLPVAVIAAGEHWADGTLRPALEDLLGAGAVLAAVLAARRGKRQRRGAQGGDRSEATLEAERRSGDRLLSPEALAAIGAFESCRDLLRDALERSVSGRELAARGWADDIVVAAALDADAVVPTLDGGAFVAR